MRASPNPNKEAEREAIKRHTAEYLSKGNFIETAAIQERWPKKFRKIEINPSLQHKPELNEVRVKALCDLYQTGISQTALAEKFGVSHTTIRTYLKKEGVRIRSSLEQSRAHIDQIKESTWNQKG